MPLSKAVVRVMISVERDLDCRPELIFDAYADIDQRTRWSVPDDEIVVFESHDFRVGGIDRFIRGPREHPTIAGTIRYEHIVSQECIVFTERLSNPNNELLAVSLITWLIVSSGTSSRLTITDQTTSVAGSRPIEGAQYGYEVMLDRLTHHLANRGS